MSVAPAAAPAPVPVIEATDLARHYQIRRGLLGGSATIKAVDGVSFTLSAGKTLAVVGESGSGKSTLARLVVSIEPASAGRLRVLGEDPDAVAGERRRELRRAVQMVFQDPYASLNPRKKVGAILEEPLVINTAADAAERRARALAMLAAVGLRAEHYGRYPHMFSGGQRQRIAIARALMLNPRLVVADEPVSALDISVQAQVLNLMMDLQERFELAYLFISHDLSVVRHIADEVLVLYFGRPVETGAKAHVFARPRHPYTMALLAATPQVNPAHRLPSRPVRGELSSLLNPPSGCAFHTRCPYADSRCRADVPAMRPLADGPAGQRAACHHAERIAAAAPTGG